MESVLRPRDIQARIRSGESPETVAAAAQTSVDRIMGFATPVLAERAYVAEQALKASVRRRAGDGPVSHLGEAVAERLRARDIDPASVSWDSWRREDGRWTLVADYLSGESTRHAEFVYDTGGRYVVAEDDESRWLIGERSTSHGPQPRPSRTASAPTRRRPMAAVDEQLPLGDDAIELVTGRAPAREQDEPTVDLTETATSVRAVDDLPAQETPAAPAADADWIATQASERPAAPESAALPEPEDDTATEAPAPVDSLFSGPRAVETASPEDSSEAHPDADGEETAQPRRQGKSRRASVPSWDEIMFGSDKNT